jgi:hypothetical protein
MGYFAWILRKLYPRMLKYEFLIRTFVDLLFVAVFILILVKVRPEIVTYCPVNMSVINFIITNLTNASVVVP